MSAASLRMELRVLVTAIDAQINVLRDKAKELDVSIHRLQNMDGTWPMIDLLNAKASVLLALTNLEKS